MGASYILLGGGGGGGGGNPVMDQHSIQGGVAILLGMLHANETRISSGHLGFCLVCALYSDVILPSIISELDLKVSFSHCARQMYVMPTKFSTRMVSLMRTLWS